jgi:hypothetical protein
MKFCYGPMSINVVDTVIEFSLKNPTNEITFIPSRRQIEHNGGYVNNWKTSDFVKYVKDKNNKIIIERDHGGPNQGLTEDDGFESLSEDAKYMDVIHIDPWKKYDKIDEGIEYTVKMINHCHNINPSLLYEIATEEAIRPFSVEDLEYIIIQLKQNLTSEIFNKIKYLVIQCGTSLKECVNTGSFDEEKLKEMLNLAYKYNMTAKEHNGDWVDSDIIKQKELHGLTTVNVAPMLGEIESRVILGYIKNSQEDYDAIYKLCIESGKWKKWVSDDFDYINKKDEIILITGHYIFSNPKFIEIKQKYIGIDNEIQSKIYDKLLELDGIYSVRKNCIFCKHDDFELLFETNNFKSPLSLGLSKNTNEKSYFMPYDVQVCKNCNSVQNKYIGNLSIVYDVNHIDDYGTTKSKKHNMFSEFIIQNKNINGIVEVGSCNGVLANIILNSITSEYYIIEPSFTGKKQNINIIPHFFENVDLNNINSNTVIMSDVFEHFYNPIDILNKIQKSESIKYIYLNHPDFDYSIKHNILINLNCEHTFLIEHQFLFTLFEKFGFKLNKRYDFENFSLFLEFERIQNDTIVKNPLLNYNLYNDTKLFFNQINTIINNINIFIDQHPNKKYFIWPMSIHSITLLTNGLKYEKLEGILDNSPNKIGKYMYKYNLLCFSFNELLNSNRNDYFIIISGAGNYINELNIENQESKIRFLDDFLIS